MYFDSFAAALLMDGHGVYVWTVVAVTALVVIGMLLLPVLSSRRFLAGQRVVQHRGAASPEVSAPTAIIEEVNNAPGS